MKKILFLVASLLLAGNTVLCAQTLYDANNLMGNDLNGTARFVGMGGAMGALGGDISTISSNPAGIGLFRSNDAMLTFGLNNLNVKSKFGNTSNSVEKTRGTFDNIGVVFSNKNSDYSSLRYFNFAVNYRRSNSFNRDMLMGGNYRASQTEQIATMTPTTPADLSANDAYLNSDIPWLGVLGKKSFLINPVTSNGTFVGYDPYYTFGNAGSDAGHFVNGTYRTRERGGIDNVDFNVAFNISDRFYFGATMGTYYIDYDKSSTYSETFWANATDKKNDGQYALKNDYNADGSGVDFKLGFIFRPIETSPLRFGIALHTPTFYHLTEHQFSTLTFDTYDTSSGTFKQGISKPYDENGNDMESETKYRIITPWKYNFSVGYTIGSIAALGAEYEYADYSQAKMEYDNGDRMDYETNTIKNMLTGVSTLRLGAEFKLAPAVSFRVGYNYISPSTKDYAYKQLANNAVRTDTEYSNTKSINNLTFGLGFRAQFFYCDMAYIYTNRKSDFYPFNTSNSSSNAMPVTKVTDENSHVLLTMGFRF